MHLEDFKAGGLENRYEYQSFLPSPIHHPWVISDQKILQRLGQADRALGELNAFSQLIPDIDFFIRMYVAKEAEQSSRIEGTQTTLEDAFKAADDLAPEAYDDWAEVKNYIKAIHHGIAGLDTLPLCNRLLQQTHGVLMQGVRGEKKQPGQFRRSQNWIGVSLKNAAFIPPHHEHVESLMGDLEKFLHDRENFLPPLLRIAIAHYQFETIHPFLDGNGRLGRLMISLYLASEGLLSKPSLYLSDYFERNKTAYVDHLMAVREGNHMHAWLLFFLHGVEEIAHASIQVFKDILALKAHIEKNVLPRFGPRRRHKAQALIQYLYKYPVVRVNEVVALLETTPATAGALIADLVKYRVLLERTGRRRNRIFIFNDYLALFRR